MSDGVWTTQAVIDWLHAIGVTTALFDGAGRVPDGPDEHAIVTRTPGVGQSLEGAADTPGFQLRWRGRQNVPGSPENTAVRDDKLICFSGWPATVGGVHVERVTRSGGAPSPDGPPDAGARSEWVCTYLTTVMEDMHA